MAAAAWLLVLAPGVEHQCSVVRTMSGRRALIRFASNSAELVVSRNLLYPVPKLTVRPAADLLSE